MTSLGNDSRSVNSTLGHGETSDNIKILLGPVVIKEGGED